MIVELVKKLLHSLVEILLFFPILLFIGLYAIPDSQLWVWIGSIPIMYLIGIITRNRMNVERRLYQYLLAIGIGGAVSYFLFGQGLSAEGIAKNGWFGAGIFAVGLSLILGCVFVKRGMMFAEKPWHNVFPSSLFIVGFLFYFVAYFVYKYNDLTEPYSALISWLGLVSIIAAVFILNFRTLQTETLSGNKQAAVAANIVRQNRAMLLVLLAIIIIIAAFRQIKDWLYAMMISILKWIFSLFSGEPSEAPVEINPTPAPAEQMPMPAGKDPFPLFVILEKIAYYVMVILLIAASLYGIYRLIRQMGKWLIQLKQWLLQSKAGRNENMKITGYVDERTSIWRAKSRKTSFLERLQEWVAGIFEKEPRWEDLKDNKERVRYLYRHYLLRSMGSGYLFKNFLTPNETTIDIEQWDQSKPAPKDLTTLYNQARYGNTEIADRDVDKLK